jgi:hypothetical protein
MAQRPPEIPSELMEPAASPKGNSFKYVAFWAVMACLGGSYLAAASIRPAFLAGYLPVVDSRTSEAAARNAADIVNVRDTMHQLQTEMTNVGDRLRQHGEDARSLSERVAALEQRPSTAATASEPAQRVGAAHPENHNGTDFPTDVMPGPNEHAAPPKAQAKQQPKVINAPLETGSLTEDQPAPAAKAAPAKPKAATAAPPKEKAEAVGSFTEPKVTKPVGIKLATGGSVDNLRVSWGVLAERHGQELSALQPRYYNNVDGSGITYELVAGPFKNTAEAKKVCQALKAQAVDCQVSTFGGNAL